MSREINIELQNLTATSCCFWTHCVPQCYATAIQSTISPNTCMKIVPALFLAFCYLTCLSIFIILFFFNLMEGESRKKQFWWILVRLTDHMQSMISPILQPIVINPEKVHPKTFTENWVSKQSFFVLILTTA